MALDKQKISADIAEAFIRVMDTEGNDRRGAINMVADRIADAVMDAIRSATINYDAGLTAPAGGGAVTGTFTGSLS